MEAIPLKDSYHNEELNLDECGLFGYNKKSYFALSWRRSNFGQSQPP